LLPLGCAAAPQKAEHDQHGTTRWPGSGREVSCPNLCGSELARESGGSACINIECAALFASKPAPTLGGGEHSICNSPPIPVGASLLAMKSTRFQTKTSHPHRRQTLLLQTPPTPHHQPTHPCAFAYNYARIRPLVRLVLGFYCFPATAHQWSGLVARLRIRSHESHQSGIARTRWWLCAWRLRARRVFRCPTGLLTCAQLPPFRLVARR